MNIKINQVTDLIHDTIYLSKLETDLINTPYFHRLHDVYQSSTAYLTYPSNRTKRYEHSLGTMELASQMIFSALNNANIEVQNDFFSNLNENFIELTRKLHRLHKFPHYLNGIPNLHIIVDKLRNKQGSVLIEYITKYLEKKGGDDLKDIALSKYQFSPFSLMSSGSQYSLIYLNFLYQCLLEAVRLSALFHDIGHPPFSHIIEDTLIRVYEYFLNESDNNQFDDLKVNDLLYSLKDYLPTLSDDEKVVSTILEIGDISGNPPHEYIGLSLIELIFKDDYRKRLPLIINNSTSEDQLLVEILRLIAIAEFTFAILTEKNNFFKSIHKIISGTTDADRFDYVVRDSHNSGVHWGKIPYKRVIGSLKFFHPDNDDKNKDLFILAYPYKIQSDLEDLLVLRYKIYSRINFHHKTVRNATFLQNTVEKLITNYIKSSNTNNNFLSIEGLWKFISNRLPEDPSKEIINWNDSWLITVINNAYYTNAYLANPVLDKEPLEEFVLGRVKYHTLFKRGSDCINFAHENFKKAGLTVNNINQLLEDIEGLKDRLSEEHYRLTMVKLLLLRNYYETGDLDNFRIIKPDYLKEIVDQLEKDKSVEDVVIYENSNKFRDGLPDQNSKTKSLYIYDNNNEIDKMDISGIEEKINIISNEIPYLYIFVDFYDYVTNTTDAIKNLKNEIGDNIASYIENEINGIRLLIQGLLWIEK